MPGQRREGRSSAQARGGKEGVTPGNTPFRSAAKACEILRENVGLQFLSLRHYAEILSNTRVFALLRASALKWQIVSFSVSLRHFFIDNYSELM